MSELKLILAPTVTVVARPYLDREALARHLEGRGFAGFMPGEQDAQALVEVAGRGCYDSWRGGRSHEQHLRHLLESRHGSCLEHCQWSFLISGVSRSLTHELIRHRAGVAISERSQRYVDCSEVAFVVPPALVRWHRDWVNWRAAMSEPGATDLDDRPDFAGADKFSDWYYGRQADLDEYMELTEQLLVEAPADLSATDRRKWARQAARSVLPECAESSLCWSANARTLRHTIEQRCSAGADAEIRRLFGVILGCMIVEAPLLFSDYQLMALADGTFAAQTPWSKV